MLLSVPGRSGKLKWWFLFFLFLTAAFIIWMKNFLYPLGSGDIVELEMAKTSERAAAIIQQWRENGKFQPAIQSIYCDYVFIFLYTITIYLGCRYLSSLTSNEILARTGKLFSYLVFAAAIFDIVENVAMLSSLQNGLTNNQVSLTHKMAISKFSIILMTLFYIGICFISCLANYIEKKINKRVSLE